MEENPYQRMQAIAGREVARSLGVDLQILFAKNDALIQSEQLLNAIHSSKHSELDGIVCAPVGTTRTALMQAARSAAAAGIGWAVLNREVDYITELRSSHQVPIFAVSPDQGSIGRIQGQQIGVLLPAGGHTLYLLGPTGNSASEKRLAGMQAGLPANVEPKTLVGDWSEESGYRAVGRWLQLRAPNTPAVRLVASQNDDMAIGAKKAFEEMTSGDEQDWWLGLPYIGCDCCAGAGREWVNRGLLTSSVINPPSAGLALQMMVRAIQTKTQPPERTILAPESYPETEKLRNRPSRNAWIDRVKAMEVALHETDNGVVLDSEVDQERLELFGRIPRII